MTIEQGKSEPTFICPKCGRNDTTVLAETKRGMTVKCRPEKGGCGFDGFKPEDYSTRDSYVRQACSLLKQEFPFLSFVRNHAFPFDSFTGRESDEPARVDYKVYLGPNLLERVRFLTVRGMTPTQYCESPENYIAGLPDVVKRLSSKDRDCIFGFHFVDGNPPQVGLAEARRMLPFLRETTDRFSNLQLTCPVEVRGLLLTVDHEEKRRILLRHLPDIILGRQEVL